MITFFHLCPPKKEGGGVQKTHFGAKKFADVNKI